MEWNYYKYNNDIIESLDLTQTGTINKLNNTVLISNNNVYKFEIDEVGNFNIKRTIVGCEKQVGNTNGNNFMYTVNNNNDYYLYSADADKKMDRLFFS
jgi:hypothetical protein